MKRLFRSENIVVESRFFLASIFLTSIIATLWLRVWYLQVYRGEYYRRVSETNRIRKIESPASRGMIFDAYGKLMLGNTPSSDLVFIPQFSRDREKTFEIVSRLLHVPIENLERKYKASRSRPEFMPITLQRNLSLHEVAIIESNKIFLPGIEINVNPRREYLKDVPPHLIGYLAEISPKVLEEQNKKNSENPYLPGDLIGKQGLESKLETYLRGKRGYKLIQVDAFGRQSSLFKTESWSLPEVNATAGANIELTIDMELQKAVNDSFAGKNGSVIVMDPRSGAILAITSQPGYDPYMYQRGVTTEEWRALMLDIFHPLLDKSTGGEYPPGSVYKAVVALAGLEEKIVNDHTTYNCPGYFMLGGERFNCHVRAGHGAVSLDRALMQSCDVYFYHLGVELGADRIAKYARALGLGQRLGFDLNMERPGLVPTTAWKRQVHQAPWSPGETPPISIGQGYNLMTPMQMASLYATIANKGTIWRPFVVKRIVNSLGEMIEERRPEMIGKAEGISAKSFEQVIKGLQAVVMNEQGTGKAARVPGVDVAGKSGSVQVVNLKKNRNQTDVSVLWREHAMFTSFAPSENPEIVVAVVSEHDEKRGGGASAGPVAGHVLRTYFELKKKRTGKAIGSSGDSHERVH